MKKYEDCENCLWLTTEKGRLEEELEALREKIDECGHPNKGEGGMIDEQKDLENAHKMAKEFWATLDLALKGQQISYPGASMIVEYLATKLFGQMINPQPAVDFLHQRLTEQFQKERKVPQYGIGRETPPEGKK